MTNRSVLLVCAPLLLLWLAAPACGGEETTGGGGGSSTSGTFSPLPSSDADTPDCVNLCKQQVACVDTATMLTGVVKDPAGNLPVYNAIVYVPNAPVPAFNEGQSCDRCGTVPGSPLVATLTDANGRFTLKDVPSGENIPLVVQVGRWRRQMIIPTVSSCQNTPLTEIRLPKNQCEGDIPRIALTTGGDDALECWLRKVGLDDAEFTTAPGPGRVHLYAGSGATRTTAFDPGHGGAVFPQADALWSDPTKLAAYDLVLLSCEGQVFPETKSAAALQALATFAGAGGRVLTSHWQRYWWSTQAATPSPFAPFATWMDRPDPPVEVAGDVDTSHPKGAELRFWLESPSVDALDTNGRLPMMGARHNVDAMDPSKAVGWVGFENANAGAQKAISLLSANLPSDRAGAEQCGRMTYADYHASSADAHGPPWPSGCTSSGMSAQEKALEFMLFDLAACISDPAAAPAAPLVSTAPCTKCSVGDTGLAPSQTPITKSSCDAGP